MTTSYFPDQIFHRARCTIIKFVATRGIMPCQYITSIIPMPASYDAVSKTMIIVSNTACLYKISTSKANNFHSK